MYYVVGGNGQQYGPVDEETVRAWIGEGRVGSVSLSFRTGETEWTPMGSRPEFQELFAARPVVPQVPAVPAAMAPPGTLVVGAPYGTKDWLTALLLSIFLGLFAVDRFYLGYVGLGIVKLLVSVLTCGIAGWIWWLIDIILIATGSLKDAQGRALIKT